MTTTVEVTELEYHDDTSNSHKYYRVYTIGTVLVKQWGRVGTMGSAAHGAFMTKREALQGAQDILHKKMLKGYQAIASGSFETTTTGPRPSVTLLAREWAREKHALQTGNIKPPTWNARQAHIIEEELDLADILGR